MRPTPWLLLAALATALLLPGIARAQNPRVDSLQVPDSGQVRILRTRDGSTYIGRIVEVVADTVRFRTEVGLLVVPRASIVEIRGIPASAMRNGSYWPPNPHVTRLLFAPTGRMLPSGEGYYSNVYLFFNSVAVAATDRITIGGGLSVFPLEDFSDNLFYLTPKVGLIQGDKFNLAAGALIGAAGGVEGSGFGILYGVATVGGTEGSVTLGTGVGYQDGDFEDEPVVVLGGERRLSRRTAFVTENYLIPEVDQPIVSYGLRFFGERLAVDLAFINTIGDDAIFPGVPYVDFVVHF